MSAVDDDQTLTKADENDQTLTKADENESQQLPTKSRQLD
jgi:hypothetical protein